MKVGACLAGWVIRSPQSKAIDTVCPRVLLKSLGMKIKTVIKRAE